MRCGSFMKLEETKKKNWFKLVNKKVRANFEFLNVEHLGGGVCKLNFGSYESQDLTQALSFRFECYKNIRTEGDSKDYVGYFLSGISAFSRQHTKEEGLKFFLSKSGHVREIEVWGAKRVFIIVDD